MKKIKFVSRIFFLFFRALCWIIPFITAYFILFNLEGVLDWGSVFLIVPPVHVQNTSLFSLTHRMIILAIQFLPLSITVLICYKLANLFRLYEKGNLFEEENISLIRSIGIFMLIGQMIQLVYQPLITAALTFNNPSGERLLSLTIGSTNASTVITAIIILLASWIIREANQLKSDSQLTI